MQNTYKKGEIIFAKLRGYPWWPARISKIVRKPIIKFHHNSPPTVTYQKKPIFHLIFFADFSTGTTKTKYMKKFIDGYKKFSKKYSQPVLAKAIKNSKKVFLQENNNLSIDIKTNFLCCERVSSNKFDNILPIIEDSKNEENKENSKEGKLEKENENYEYGINEISKNDEKIMDNSIIIVDGINMENENENEIKKENDKSNSNNQMEMSISTNGEEHLIMQEIENNIQQLENYFIVDQRDNDITVKILTILSNIDFIITYDYLDYDIKVIRNLLGVLTKYESDSDLNINYKSNLIKEKLEQKISNNSHAFENQELFQKEIKPFLSKDLIPRKLENDEKHSKICADIINKIRESREKERQKEIDDQLEIIINDQKLLEEERNSIETNTISTISNKNEFLGKKTKKYHSHSLNDKKPKENSRKNLMDNKPSKKKLIDYMTLSRKNKYGNYLENLFQDPKFFKTKYDFKIYPDDFFKDENIHVGINSKNGLLRKKICLKLYLILHSIFQECNQNILKKNVIFLEYLARSIDPSLSKDYILLISMIIKKIKLASNIKKVK